MDFSKTLITWYNDNRRDLPWRQTKDPYKIWLSEIILQQTRVAQGLPYYEAFIKQFPRISDLATADEEAVLHLWQGLGYYSRARNLHLTAKMI
ncbi:A/G-specific adenine glycosylase, partial [Arthrospira platensis SPKY2]